MFLQNRAEEGWRTWSRRNVSSYASRGAPSEQRPAAKGEDPMNGVISKPTTLAALLALALAATTGAVPAAAQDWAKARLEKSPRHMEWVKLKQGAREGQSFIVYPEVEE